MPPFWVKLLEDALHKAFLDVDRGVKDVQDANRDGDRSGCTAIVAFVTPTHLVLAHAGDSRAVLASGDEVRRLVPEGRGGVRRG